MIAIIAVVALTMVVIAGGIIVWERLTGKQSSYLWLDSE